MKLIRFKLKYGESPDWIQVSLLFAFYVGLFSIFGLAIYGAIFIFESITNYLN